MNITMEYALAVQVRIRLGDPLRDAQEICLPF